MADALRALGAYEILELAGQGGMGAVYRARHAKLDRVVALKVLRPQYALDARVLARFRREAQVAAAVSHPALVEVYDFGRDNDLDYIAMEWVEGRSLKELVDDGPVDLERTLELGVAALEALVACHAQGVLHRDLKPANLMVDAAGSLRVLDFGLVTQHGRTALTRTGEMLGTPRYLPPELLNHEDFGADSDVYQMGLVLHECLRGRAVFDQPGIPELIAAITGGPIPALPDPGPNRVVDSCLRRMLARARGERFADTRQALAALRHALSAVKRARATPAPRRTGPTVALPPSVRPRAPLVPAVLAVAALALVAGGLLVRFSAPPPPPPPATPAPPTVAPRERSTGGELARRALRWMNEVVHPKRFREAVHDRLLVPLPGKPPGPALLAELDRFRKVILTPAYHALRAELVESPHLVETATDLAPDQRCNLLRRAAELEDVHAMIELELGLAPGWEPLPVPGLTPVQPPPGLTTFLALDFAEGKPGKPDLFMDDDEATLHLGEKISRDYTPLGPVALPAGARAVYLVFKIQGGRRDERVGVSMVPLGTRPKAGEMAVLRGTGGGVREGALALDRRLFGAAGHEMRLQVTYDGPPGKSQGIRMLKFELAFVR